jgi:hypothetical protein
MSASTVINPALEELVRQFEAVHSSASEPADELNISAGKDNLGLLAGLRNAPRG